MHARTWMLIGLLLALPLSLARAAASAPGKKEAKIAVLPLTAQGVEPRVSLILDTLLVTEVDALGHYEVIGSQDINAMLGLDKMKEALGCSELSCAAEIGGALGVEFLLSGVIGRLGSRLMINLQRIDVVNMKVLKRVAIQVPNNEDLFADGIHKAVADLFVELNAPKTLSAASTGKPAGAGATASAPGTGATTPASVAASGAGGRADGTGAGESSAAPGIATPAPASSGLSIVWPIIPAAAGAVSLGVGALFGSQATDIASKINDGNVEYYTQAQAATAEGKATLATVFMVVGGVCLAGSVPLFVLALSGPDGPAASASLLPVAAPGYAGALVTVAY